MTNLSHSAEPFLGSFCSYEIDEFEFDLDKSSSVKVEDDDAVDDKDEVE